MVQNTCRPLTTGNRHLIIRINEQYRVATDPYQWIIQRKRTRKGNEVWESQTYHPSVDAAVHSLGERMVRECKTDTLVDNPKGGRNHRHHALPSSDAQFGGGVKGN